MRNDSRIMKTTILDDLELPEEVQRAARQEAIRRKVPVKRVLSEWVVSVAEALVKSAKEHEDGLTTRAA